MMNYRLIFNFFTLCVTSIQIETEKNILKFIIPSKAVHSGKLTEYTVSPDASNALPSAVIP